MNRNKVIKIRYILENLIPAAIRDNRTVAKILYYIATGKKRKFFIDYYENFYMMTQSQINEVYKKIYEGGHPLKSQTDLNIECLDKIKSEIIGNKVIDIGCGNAFLLNELIKLYPKINFSGCDFLETKPIKLHQQVSYTSINLEQKIPFLDNSFDTVICTHVAEHILNFQQLISELRRIASKKLIIVVPKERPYKYNFGLHIHFFPYKESLIYAIGKNEHQSVIELGGDLYYTEEYYED